MTSTKWNFELIIRDRPTAFCLTTRFILPTNARAM